MKRIRVLKATVPALMVLAVALSSYGGEVAVEEWEERLNQRQPPQKVMEAIGLEPGMVIADIGAGRGRYTVWFADRVGDTGKVYANDIDAEALARLQQRCREQGLANVEIVPGTVADPKLPPGTVDIAFMINVYHHLDKPVELIRATLSCLAPGGVVAIVECDPAKGGFDRDHGTARAEMLRQLGEAGLVEIKVIDPPWLKHDYIYIGKVGKE